MVGDPGQFHHDDAHVLGALRHFDFGQFLHRHVPPNIIDRGRTIVQAVGDRCDLVERPVLCQFLKSPVDISYGWLSAYDTFTIHFQDILENTVRGRVRRPQVQGSQFAIQTVELGKIGLYVHVRVGAELVAELGQGWGRVGGYVLYTFHFSLYPHPSTLIPYPFSL